MRKRFVRKIANSLTMRNALNVEKRQRGIANAAKVDVSAKMVMNGIDVRSTICVAKETDMAQVAIVCWSVKLSQQMKKCYTF